jgi:thioredoxin-like negative regulator of GroEL
MLSLGRGNEMVKADLLDLIGDKIDYQLVYLDFSSTDETRKVVGQILAKDPDLRALDADRRTRLFQDWWNQGDRDELVRQLSAHPDWLDSGWIFLAQAYAAQKDYQDAWTIVARCAPAPVVPAVSSTLSVSDLQSAFYDQEDNFAAGLLLYLAQTRQGQTDAAISTLRAMEKSKSCPKYIFYLEAKLWAAKQQWELAWNAWWSSHET